MDHLIEAMLEGGDVVRCKPWGKEQGDFVLVNKADFDPEFHQLFDAPAAAKAAPKAKKGAE